MSDQGIDQVYERVAKESSDMIEHLPTLKAYASQCPRIIEFGVWDCTSTWGLLAGHPTSSTISPNRGCGWLSKSSSWNILSGS